MPGVADRAREIAAKIWPFIVLRSQQGREWANRSPDVALAAAIGASALFVLLLFGGLSWLWDKYHDNRSDLTPIVTLIGAAIAAWVALRQVRIALSQAKTAAERHDAQTRVDQERRITESFSRAVEQLASDHIEVRVGGIYALERISQESSRDYWTVMETLTAFVRERTQRTEAERTAQPLEQRLKDRAKRLWEQAGQPDGHDDEFWERAVAQEPYGKRPTTDIAAALTVIKRRREEDRAREVIDNKVLDFEEAILRGADFREAHLERTNFFSAHLEGANFQWAHLQRAMLVFSRLKGASFFAVEGADLAIAEGLTQNQIYVTFGDDMTKLPEGLTPPAHWIDPKLRPPWLTAGLPHNCEL